MDEGIEKLRTAIAALEAQRSLLGEAVAEMALAPLRDKLAAAEAHALAAEQRLKSVTVLFMDVVGSTDLTRQLDPEDVHAVMDSALERMSAVVRTHRGRVLQYAGDSLLAVFGADQAQEDDAERAVRAGLAIIAEAPGLAERVRAQHGLDGFNLRVGLNTGPVLLGGAGVDAAGSIRGLTVNIAARMEQTAPAGGLRISHDTYRHVRGLFEFDAQPPITVKGIPEPVRSYLVLRERSRAFRVANRGLEGVETPMVGRDAELAQLTETFESVREEGTLALVTVVGDAGLGKSRLGFEFARWLEICQDPLTQFSARPQPNGNNVPYGLVRDLLARRFDILDGDSQGVAQAKLATGLGPVLGERATEQTALIGRLIGLDYEADPHIAGVASEAKQLRDRAFHALAEYFRRVQTQGGGTLVLLLDDLHWADEGSLDFINHLAQACRDLPVMVLGMTRGTLLERRPLWGSGQDNHERIDLAPLSRRRSRELVELLLNRLKEVPAALRDLLIQSAEGNPYFVEELVGMLIDDGVIATGAEWRVLFDRLHQVHVPPTLAGVLQARIDGLPTKEKSALQQASVVGYVFWEEVLRLIEPKAPDALDGLMRRDLTCGRETSAFEGTHELVFKHHVLHQVAYDSVLKRDKREQHRITADWLAARSGDRASEYFGLIANHYERAGDAVNAVIYLRKAGEAAAASFASEAALDWIGRALALSPPDDAKTRFALLLTRRAVLNNIGRRTEQQADVAALEQIAEQQDDDEMRARAGSMRASLALVTGDYPGACAAAARSVAWAEAAGVRGAALSARFNWARALYFQGDYASAEDHTEQSLRLAREVGDRRVESTALLQLGILAQERGRYGDARSYFQQALALARTILDRVVESLAINNLGESERLLGNYQAAFDLFQAGRQVCREIGQVMTDAYLLCNIAHVAFLQGRARESIEWSDQSRAVAQELKDPDLRASVLGTRGHAHSALGEPIDAAACYRESLAIYRDIGRPTMPPEPIAGLARLALARGAVAEAMDLMAEVVAHFDAGGTVDGTENPLWIYLTCHQVFKAAGSARAPEFLAQAHALLMLRAEPLAPAERETFLGNVPSHRAIVNAWTEAAQTNSPR